MICRECERRLSDYIDEYLSPAEALRIERHFAQCWKCSQLHADLTRLVAESRTLPELTPAPDLWDRIVAEVKRGPRPQPFAAGFWRRLWNLRFNLSCSFPQLVTAGSAALVFIIGLNAVAHRLTAVPGDETELTAPAAPGIEFVLLSQPPPGFDQHQMYSIASFQGIVDNKKDHWDPKLRMIFERSLASINSSLDECCRAIHENPFDPVAREMLEVGYAKKLKLLRDFAEF